MLIVAKLPILDLVYRKLKLYGELFYTAMD